MIETVLPKLLEVAGRAVGKALGDVASSGISRLSVQRGLKEHKIDRLRDDEDEFLQGLSLSRAEAILRFIDSPEMSLLAHKMTCAMFSKHSPGSEKAVRDELQQLLRLHLAEPDDFVTQHICDILFSYLCGQLAAFMSEASAHKYLSPTVAGRLLAAASFHLPASRRNTELLRRIKSLVAIETFVDQMRGQVIAVHSKMRLPYTGSTRMVPYEQLYVEPRLRFSNKASTTLPDIVETSIRSIITGNPGGGKSTLSTKIALDTAAGMSTFLTEVTVPFFVTLREFAKRYSVGPLSIAEYCELLCRSLYHVEPPQGAVEYLLLNGRALLVLDGLDELTNVSLRQTVVDIVHSFVNRFPLTPIFTTSRHIGYEQVPLDRDLFVRVSLDVFDDNAVKEYAHNWFKLDETIPSHREESVRTAFINDSELVPDLRSNPLMLALMCGIYSAEGYIPRNRPEVYEKCSTMLFEKWDKERDIKVELPFNAHVRSSVYALAAWMYRQPSMEDGIPRHKVHAFMSNYLHEKRYEDREDAEDAAAEFIDYCSGRAWVLTDLGSDRAQAHYGFTHRTFLEYFTAKQITREYPTAEKLYGCLVQDIEAERHDVVSQIAVQLLGQNVEDGADDFLALLCKSTVLLPAESKQHRNALSFLSRALGFVVPRPEVVRQITSLAFDEFVRAPGELRSSPSLRPAISYVMCSATENLRSVSRALEVAIGEQVQEINQEHILALSLYPGGFAATNYDQYSVAHGEFWNSVSQDYRSIVDGFLNSGTVNRWPWVKQYLLARGALGPLQVLTDSRHLQLFLKADFCTWLDLQPLAAAVASALAGTTFPGGRNDVACDVFTRGDIAENVTELLLNTQRPWVLTRDFAWTEGARPELFARSELFDDLRVNGLYAVLITWLTDSMYEGHNLKHASRSSYWHASTGSLFLNKDIATYPVPPQVRNFLARWLGGGYNLVSGGQVSTSLGEPRTATRSTG